MVDRGYTSEEDLSKILRSAFGICEIKWNVKHPDYEYCGLATCTAKININNLGISVVAFPLLVEYAQPGLPIYLAHIISNVPQNGDSEIIDESQIAKYAKNGIVVVQDNGKTALKKTVDAKTHNTDSANTIDPDDLKKAIYSILETTAELKQNAIKTEH